MTDEQNPENEPTAPGDGSEEIVHADGTAVAVHHGRIEQVDLQLEMQRSYLDYAMSVIVGRALPDVRDGLKPVHRRVLYAMYDGGYRPDRSYSKCSRVVGDVMGKFHPHGDSAIYDALVRLVQDWSLRYPLVAGQGNFGSPGNDPAAAPRYTECRMAPIAMEMVRDIDKDTVDFQDNYDGRTQEPSVLPARFPNLLVNGSAGIAVGMATNIPPHNLREVAAGVQWHLDHPDASREELLAALLQRIKGPDFPTGATILGHKGIEEAYRTGRGSITMRAVVNVEEIQGRVCLVVTELPYQVNPDNLAAKIADLVKEGRVQGIADIRDETSGRTGQRLVVVLKRDAVAKVVLNNLYKHTQLQDTFGANMLALVDGVPRTLSLDAFVRHWTTHQLDVVVRRTRYLLAEAERSIHILRGYLKALDALDEVIALIRRSPDVEEARTGLMELLGVDEVQATAILNLQLRRLAALERQKILDDHDALERQILDYQDILAKPERQRSIVGDEMGEIVAKYGDERRTTILPFDGEVSIEDLIAEEEMVVTITRGGYVKRTRSDSYRAQKRGGKGVRGTQLREDDIVDHFFVTTTHHWLLFFTNLGRVYRAKAYELPGGRARRQGSARGEPARVPAGREDRAGPRPARLRRRRVPGARDAPRPREEDAALGVRLAALGRPHRDQPARGRVRDARRLVAALLVDADDDLILVSRKGQSIRFPADDDTMRPLGRATSGVTGMKFRDGDELLSADVVEEGSDLFVVTEGGFAKRTRIDEYRVQGRGGLGIKVANLVEARGDLVGALVTEADDEVLVIMERGKIVRSAVGEVNLTGRNTQGVTFAKPDKGDRIIAVARNVERRLGEDRDTVEGEDGTGTAPGVTDTSSAPTTDATASSDGAGGTDPAPGTTEETR